MTYIGCSTVTKRTSQRCHSTLRRLPAAWFQVHAKFAVCLCSAQHKQRVAHACPCCHSFLLVDSCNKLQVHERIYTTCWPDLSNTCCHVKAWRLGSYPHSRGKFCCCCRRGCCCCGLPSQVSASPPFLPMLTRAHTQSTRNMTMPNHTQCYDLLEFPV